MDTYAVYFNPLGALASPMSSDTLFGAVCWGMRVLGLKPDLADWLLAHQDNPPFAFSAPFPTVTVRDKRLHLYPRPLTFRVGGETVDQALQAVKGGKEALKIIVKNAKIINSTVWLSQGVFEQVARNTLSPLKILQNLDKDFTLQDGALFLATEVRKSQMVLSRSQPVLHNQIDRVTGATVDGALFYETETFFASGVGLWALLRATHEDVVSLIEPALRYLADTGLGGNRTTGKGHFKIELSAAPEFPNVTTSGGRLLLSRYLPTQDEMAFLTDVDRMAYRIRTIRAKREKSFPMSDGEQTGTAIFKRSVRMFEPGSVLPLPTADIHGRLAMVVDAGDGHPVYQSGAALSLPMGGQ